MKVAYVRYPLPKCEKEPQAIAFSNRRSLRPQKIADLNSRAYTQSVKNIVTGSVAGTAVANFFSDLWFDSSEQNIHAKRGSGHIETRATQIIPALEVRHSQFHSNSGNTMTQRLDQDESGPGSGKEESTWQRVEA